MTVTVTELKANLSKYLRRVQRGGEVQILHRGKPVAQLVGIRGRGDSAKAIRRLIASGVLRPGRGSTRKVLQGGPAKLPGVDLSSALNEERGDRG